MSKRLILRNSLSPGDIVMLTAAVRDLHQNYPGEFVTDVRTPCPQLWEHNPYLTPLEESDPTVQVVDCHYPLIHQSNQRPYHFIHAFIAYLNEQLGLDIKPTAFRGDIHLSETEMAWFSQVQEMVGDDRPFWVIASGGKRDFTNKWWDPVRYQEVVDHFHGRIQFVQIGKQDDHHPRLEGVLDLRGKTDLRQLVRLVYHAQGALCPVTALMHLAAAVPVKQGTRSTRPCVVVAGGREPSQWEAYPNHQFIHTIGALPCCDSGGCWKSRVVPLGDGDDKDRPENLCSNVVRRLPKCMDMISAAEVIGRIELYFSGGAVEYLNRSTVKNRLPAGDAETPPAVVWEELNREFELNENNSHEAAELALRTLPSYQPRYRGRGIVICAGGVQYFTNAWVCINMLRRLGCKLPIQLWHLGPHELDGHMKSLVAALEVECVDAEDVRGRSPCKGLAGWALKPYAIIHSPFREVLLLDADNVPLIDPEELFEQHPYLETGAVFWPDFGRMDPGRPAWRVFGVPFRHEPEFETGQVLVDKRRCWIPLWLTMWYNANSHFFYRYVHGDKDTFHMAFRLLKQPYSMIPYRVVPLKGTMCQHDFGGKRIFQHRNQAKWRFHEENPQVAGFSLEAECLSFLEDLRRLWSGTVAYQRRCPSDSREMAVLTSNTYNLVRNGGEPRQLTFAADGRISLGATRSERRWDLRSEAAGEIYIQILGDAGLSAELKLGSDGVWRGVGEPSQPIPVELMLRCEAELRTGTTDSLRWHEVVTANCYRLPERFSESDLLVDVGAHVGELACASIARGANHIYVYEPEPNNHALAVQNIRRWYRAYHPREEHCPVCMDQVAIWRSDCSEQVDLGIRTRPRENKMVDTGAVADVAPASPGMSCNALGLDVLLAELPHVSLLKVSCAGAAWPILLTAQAFSRVARIVVRLELSSRFEEGLVAHLRGKGFALVEKCVQSDSTAAILFFRKEHMGLGCWTW